jgi:hypothetical protein
VVSGTYEVRTSADKASEAERLLAENAAKVEEHVDPSPELDLELVWRGEGATAEMEAMAVKGILDASDIESVMIGASTLPNLEFQIGVPHEFADKARQAIADAQAAGPAAAEEAAAATDPALPGAGLPGPEI